MFFDPKKYLMLSVSSLILFSHLAQASASLPYVMTLSGGAAWENAGQTQTLLLDPNVEKTFSADDTTHVLPQGAFFFGLHNAWSEYLDAQLGLELAATGDANVSGDIWDDADPVFDNYTYKYIVKHSHVAVKGKFLLNKGWVVMPWVSASLGVGFNKAQQYSNTPTIFEAVTMPNFQNNTQTAFTYTIGAGIEKAINDHWQAGVGYEFSDWGKSQLDAAPDQTIGEGLTLSHLYTSAVMLNITYLA